MNYVLRNVRLIPQLCEDVAFDYGTVLVRGSRIEKIVSEDTTGKTSDDVQMIDCKGMTLLPGLIDAHAHIIMGPLEHETSEYADEYFRLFTEGLRKARKYLDFGYTAIRDMGSSYGVSNSIREAVLAGLAQGPEMISAGHIIGATEERKITDKDHNVVADGCEAVRKAVRREIAHGADIIKIYNSTYPLRRGREIYPMYTREEVQTIVQTAKSLGTYVAAHSYGSSIADCLSVGVYTIEHGGGVTSQDIEILKRESSFLVPTLGPNLCIEESEAYAPAFKQRYFETLGNMESLSIKNAYEADLKLGFGTDLDVDDFDRRHGYEFLARKKYASMENLDMLLQATRYNAEILKIDDHTGIIKEGHDADLILVDGNPEADIRVMGKKPQLVLYKGQLLYPAQQ